MIRYGRLEGEVLGKICRQCLNQKYHIRLKPKDCEYLGFKHPCSCCGEKRNIVAGIRPGSRWKLLFGWKR